MVIRKKENNLITKNLVFCVSKNISFFTDDGNFDKVVGHNQFGMIDDNHFEYTAAHYLQSFIAQVLGTLAGIAVVDVAPAMVVKPFDVAQYLMFDQDEG